MASIKLPFLLRRPFLHGLPHLQTPISISRVCPSISLSPRSGCLFLPPCHLSEVVAAAQAPPLKYCDPTISPPKPPDGYLFCDFFVSCSPSSYYSVCNRPKSPSSGLIRTDLSVSKCRHYGAVGRRVNPSIPSLVRALVNNCSNDGLAQHAFDLADKEPLEPKKLGWMFFQQWPIPVGSQSLCVTRGWFSRVRQQWPKRYCDLGTEFNLLCGDLGVGFSVGCLFKVCRQVLELNKKPLLSLNLGNTQLFVLKCTDLVEYPEDHPNLSKTQTLVEMHGNLRFLVSPMPSFPSLLGTQRCIDKMKCNSSCLLKVPRSGQIDQEGSGKTLDEGSDSMFAVRIDKIQLEGSAPIAQVEWHEVSRPRQTPRPPAKLPDHVMFVLLSLRHYDDGFGSYYA